MPDYLRDDIQVRDQDIQALSSIDEIAKFFTQLRYPENRIPIPPEQLGFPQALCDSVQQLEMITQIDDGIFNLQIYFIRLLSVTVARTRELVRQFRDLNGEFLLIITDDFNHLDFVLLERSEPSLPGFNVSARAVSVTPRQFTVNRQKPGRIAKRILSRLTLTEFDGEGKPNVIFQYRKMRSAITIADWSHPEFNNRALFSDYYLTQRLPQLDVWNAENRNQIFREIRGLFARVKQDIQNDGNSTPETLVKPIMETMGASIKKGAEADYFLFAGNQKEPGAFILAYPWNRYLDGKDPDRDKDRGESNPGALVVKLLEMGVAPWGIVTNGKVWRLYSVKAHSRATNYYEVDLEETLGLAEPGVSFRYFYLFFRAAAFAPQSYKISGEVKEISFLDFLLDESDIYARELGDRLKDHVFEQIFTHFAEGFIHSMGGAHALLELPEQAREDRLKMVFDGTLIFLYRLLFVLYAESRDLLPIREVHGYYEISLQKLKEEIASKAGESLTSAPEEIRLHFRTDSNNLFERLMNLFKIIDKGDPSKNVPIYNGGLFDTQPEPDDESYDAQMAKFLMEHKMPDQHLALGLDLLTRDVDPQLGRLGFVDYKSLGVRQLGSIYEGLLEFKVRIAPERMAVVKGTRVEEIMPHKEAQKEDRQILTDVRGRLAKKRILPAGTVYLENDRRERKATGSYYTPDYIVKYIVQNTVGPVMDEKLEALHPRMQKVAQEFNQIIRKKIEVENVKNPDEFAILQNTFGETLQQLFDIKILDPAMGSGHFLVEAVDYVTDRLV